MLVIDNLTVEQVLTVLEVVDALEHAHEALSTGDAINAPNYRVFTPQLRQGLALRRAKSATA